MDTNDEIAFDDDVMTLGEIRAALLSMQANVRSALAGLVATQLRIAGAIERYEQNNAENKDIASLEMMLSVAQAAELEVQLCRDLNTRFVELVRVQGQLSAMFPGSSPAIQ